ncbi:hypothetical protein KA012_04830 [Candidatus Woesebacteria bacterium]|nr:hypothetical protein [Candidatus Woesebacteria bacterium]
MNQSGTLTSPARQKSPPAVNPFARALAEAENTTNAGSNPSQAGGDPFAEALARSGGSFGNFQNSNEAGQPTDSMPDWWNSQNAADTEVQQKEAKRQQELKALRQKLHDQVNPVDRIDLYSAREQQVKKQIEELRTELTKMAQEVVEFHKEVDLTLRTTIVDPGQNGSYFMNFFHQLRQIIALMRQHVHSARTWAKQGASKNKKRPKRGGLLIQGTQSEQTTTVFDTMHHERSATYGGA